jgi:hypothetical protein
MEKEKREEKKGRKNYVKEWEKDVKEREKDVKEWEKDVKERETDKKGLKKIIVLLPTGIGLAVAINDRLKKASYRKVDTEWLKRILKKC